MTNKQTAGLWKSVIAILPQTRSTFPAGRLAERFTRENWHNLAALISHLRVLFIIATICYFYRAGCPSSATRPSLLRAFVAPFTDTYAFHSCESCVIFIALVMYFPRLKALRLHWDYVARSGNKHRFTTWKQKNNRVTCQE